MSSVEYLKSLRGQDENHKRLAIMRAEHHAKHGVSSEQQPNKTKPVDIDFTAAAKRLLAIGLVALTTLTASGCGEKKPLGEMVSDIQTIKAEAGSEIYMNPYRGDTTEGVGEFLVTLDTDATFKVNGALVSENYATGDAYVSISKDDLSPYVEEKLLKKDNDGTFYIKIDNHVTMSEVDGDILSKTDVEVAADIASREDKKI